MSPKEQKEYKIITVVIRVIDPKTEEVESETIKIIDGKERRDAVMKTVMWAMFNNKMVEIINKEDDVE